MVEVTNVKIANDPLRFNVYCEESRRRYGTARGGDMPVIAAHQSVTVW